MLDAIIASLGLSFLFTYLTNPFVRLTIVRLPYRARLRASTQEILNNMKKIRVYHNPFMKFIAWYQCGLYIISTRYLHQTASTATTITGIISDIHTLRFNPKKLLLISGDHFNGLFVRNLGIFFYPSLDSTIYKHDKTWRSAQETYLQTVAYALGVFDKAPELKTTLVATGRYSVVGLNFYSYPSDSLHGILYGLAALTGKVQAGGELYARPTRELDTKAAAAVLIDEYLSLLVSLYAQYKERVFDETTGLIRTDVHLSGAKDITKRRSAFYDNVIFWRTTQLAMELGILTKDPRLLRTMKKTIIKTFWYKKGGYFLEDLSDESRHHAYYSSDWLIVLSSGFLDITNTTERRYYEQSIAYIRAQGIARPFAIKYQSDTRAHRQFLAVRLAVASYGGDSIWSFWGMEYIKACLLLYRETGDHSYLTEADYHIAQYSDKMVQYKGFPEVYDAKGNMLTTPFYKSIRMTGWVVGFEQVLEMRKTVTTRTKR